MATIQELLQAQKDWEDKKSLVNAIGSASQGVGNIQSMGEILKGRPQGQMVPSQLGSMIAGSSPLDQEGQAQKLASLEKEKMQDTPDSPLAKQMYLLGAARKIPGVVQGLKPSEYKDLFEANKLVGNDEEKFANALQMQNLRSQKEKEIASMKAQNDYERQLRSLEAKQAQLHPEDDASKLAKLNSSDKQRYDNVLMLTDAIGKMKTALAQGQNRYSPIGDNDFTLGLSKAAEAFGRMQSGGAINKDEEARFVSQMRSIGDKPEVQKQKLDEMLNLAKQRYQTLGFDPSQSPVFAQAQMVSKPKPSGGLIPEAQASSRMVVKKGYNPKTNQTQLIYADGTKEIVDGKQ